MKKILLFSLLFVIASSTLFAGGPWPQKKGKAYIKLSEWWTVFDSHFTDQGLVDPNVTTGIFNTTVFVEYGFTDRFTGIVNAPVFSRNYMNNIRSATREDFIISEGEAINTIGDIDLGLKYSLTGGESRFPMALTLTLGIPTGETAGGTQQNLQTGDGEFNQMLQYDIGTGFKFGKAVSAYASSHVGFNNRTDGFSEEIRYGLEFGLGFASERLWVVGKLTGSESLKNGDTAATSTSTSIFANNSEFTSLGAEVNYYITKKFGVSAAATGMLRGEIIADAPAYSVGVFLDLGK